MADVLLTQTERDFLDFLNVSNTGASELAVLSSRLNRALLAPGAANTYDQAPIIILLS